MKSVHWMPEDEMNFMKAQSTESRIRYHYLSLILLGKVRLSFDTARKLVGPDRAFHLYPVTPVAGRRIKR